MNAQPTSLATRKFAWLGSALIATSAAIVLFLCDPVRVAIYPVCIFHRVTGLNCPACGSLRALHQLLHGNIAEALHLNAFTVLSLPLFALIGLRLAVQGSARQSALKIRPLWIWLYVAAFVLFGILRELPVPAFAAFSPH